MKEKITVVYWITICIIHTIFEKVYRCQQWHIIILGSKEGAEYEKIKNLCNNSSNS